MKFYVLVSYNIKSFRQCLVNLPLWHTVVIINSLDHEEELVTMCTNYGLDFAVTKSDGTPATGKNSVLKHFLESGEDYMVMVDGDDYITPHGVKVYWEMQFNDSPPDVVALYNQTAMDVIRQDVHEKTNLAKDLEEYGLVYPLRMKDKIDMSVEEIEKFFLFKGMSKEDAKRWSVDRYEFNQFMRKHGTEDFMNRIVWVSRKAAKTMKFGNGVHIGEDTLQYLELKRAALHGELRMFLMNDGFKPTYIMNKGERGITKQKNNNWDWVRPFLEKTKETKLPETYTELPRYYYIEKRVVKNN